MEKKSEVNEEIRCLLRREEYLQPMLEKAYRGVKMKNPTVFIEDFKMYLKHFAENCAVPEPSTAFVTSYMGKLKSKTSISEAEFIAFFKQYLATLVPPAK